MQSQSQSLSLVVLAGGIGKRLGNVKKPLVQLNGQSILQRTLNSLSCLVSEVVIVDNDDFIQQHLADIDISDAINVKVVKDIVYRGGALVGLVSGLQQCNPINEYAIVVAGDMPFLSRTLLAHLAGMAISEKRDVVIVKREEYLEPTHAIYRIKPCTKAALQAIDNSESRLVSFLGDLESVKVINLEDVCVDGDGKDGEESDLQRSFFNVNTPQDLELANRMLL